MPLPPSPFVTSEPEDHNQRLLAAIEKDYRFVLDEQRFLADIYAPAALRSDTFEEHMARLDELIDAQPLPAFMRRAG